MAGRPMSPGHTPAQALRGRRLSGDRFRRRHRWRQHRLFKPHAKPAERRNGLDYKRLCEMQSGALVPGAAAKICDSPNPCAPHNSWAGCLVLSIGFRAATAMRNDTDGGSFPQRIQSATGLQSLRGQSATGWRRADRASQDKISLATDRIEAGGVVVGEATVCSLRSPLPIRRNDVCGTEAAALGADDNIENPGED